MGAVHAFRSAGHADRVDVERRTARVVWSTGADVTRVGPGGRSFVERLSMNADAVDLSRFASGRAPVLRDHRQTLGSVIGVVRKAWIKRGRGYADIEFSERRDLDDVIDDLRAGILGQVSVGYSVETWRRTRGKNGAPDVHEAVRWTPHEISLVPIAADVGAHATAARAAGGKTMYRNHAPHRPTASAGLSARDASDALSLRLNVKTNGTPSQTARDYAGRRLLEIGQGLLQRAGQPTRGGDVELISRMISTSELTSVIATVAARAALTAYEQVPSTYQTLAARANASNFQTMERARLSGAPELLRVPEGGEIMKGPIVAGFEQYRVETYARRVALTRQAIINDDLNTLARLPAAFGAKAKQLQERLFYSLLAANPTMSDGNPLFDAAHGNLGTAGAIDKTTVAEARQLMMSQTDASGAPVRVVPQYLVFGPASADDAYTFLTPAGSYLAATASDVIPEAFRNLIPIESQEIADASWYLFADPRATPAVEYAYLNGSDGPEITSQPGWEVLGVDTRCILDFGIGAVDWVGVVKNAGA